MSWLLNCRGHKSKALLARLFHNCLHNNLHLTAVWIGSLMLCIRFSFYKILFTIMLFYKAGIGTQL